MDLDKLVQEAEEYWGAPVAQSLSQSPHQEVHILVNQDREMIGSAGTTGHYQTLFGSFDTYLDSFNGNQQARSDVSNLVDRVLTQEGSQDSVKVLLSGDGPQAQRFDVSARRLNTPNGDVAWLTYKDETDIYRRERELFAQVRKDPLTELPNRTGFTEVLVDKIYSHVRAYTGLLEDQHMRSDQEVSVLYLDLDGFKAINDTHGHHKGDYALKRVAAQLKTSIRASDRVGRLGGDEFAIVCTGDAVTLAENISKKIAELNDELNAEEPTVQYNLGVSIGVKKLNLEHSHIPLNSVDHSEIALTLMNQADQLMYDSKNAGGMRITHELSDRRITYQPNLS